MNGEVGIVLQKSIFDFGSEKAYRVCLVEKVGFVSVSFCSDFNDGDFDFRADIFEQIFNII